MNSVASGTESPNRVYEMRIYHVNEDKMDALKARFRNHSDALLARHNIESIGYWETETEPGSPNLLVYMVVHASHEDAQKNWAAFLADPEWKKVKADSEVDGPLVNRIERFFMEPTSFSKLK